MNFLNSMQWRYTAKMYDSSKQISSEILDELKEILRLSPSSINSQPWRFIFVTDSVMKNKLSQFSYFNGEKIRDCHTLVIFSVIDDVEKFERWAKDNLPEGANEYYKKFIKPLSQEQIKAWFTNQLYISLGVLLSACASMGIDSSPMEGIECEKYNEALNLSGFKTKFAVAIGTRDAEDYNQPSKNPKSRRAANNLIYSI
ncbi:MAG: NAD(P)H-dependent oxidoreductase [Rikenellaceae bacterium]